MNLPRNPTLGKLAMLTLAVGSVLLAGACSLMLDASAIQCQSDIDCKQFTASVCDVTNRVCVGRPDASVAVDDVGATADVVEGCSGPSGCFSCTPTNESQILSRCTDTVCMPFDNKRLTLMGENGALRPLP
jgi:hypothetical protein